jgi:epoxyqueuosine reductase
MCLMCSNPTTPPGGSVIGTWHTQRVVTLTTDLIETGLAHGAAAVGACRATPFTEGLEGLRFNLETGRSGSLRFTYRDPETASDVTRSFPWARSLVVVAIDYLPHSSAKRSSGPEVARFATADHYRLLDPALGAIVERLDELGHRAETLVDDDRLLDRAAAVRAGLGWRGRSSMVLAPGRGPWTLFGSVVTDAALDPTPEMARDCGTCVACVPACPTDAIDAHGIDARRCLSAWLQTGGSIPHWVRPHLGRRIYGCDDCLTVCPPGRVALGRQDQVTGEYGFEELLTLDDRDLVERFAWWYIPHRDPRMLRRNILVAAGNSGEEEAVPAIAAHSGHRSALLRGHAAWALARSVGAGSVTRLERLLDTETEPSVRSQVLLALLMVEDPGAYQSFLTEEEGATTGRGYPGAMASKREPVTTAIRAIKAAGIAYRPHLFDYDRYPGAMGAARALGVDPHLTVKTIVFETSNGEGVIVLMNGDREVSARNLARLLGVKSVKPASADRGRKWTGYEFGGTSPFGTRESLRVFANAEIAEMGTIYVNAGSRGFLVAMEATNLIAALSPELADLAV